MSAFMSRSGAKRTLGRSVLNDATDPRDARLAEFAAPQNDRPSPRLYLETLLVSARRNSSHSIKLEDAFEMGEQHLAPRPEPRTACRRSAGEKCG